MIHCIAGAIMACTNMASIHIPGDVGYARAYPASYAYNYAVYAVPIQQPTYTVIMRRT